MVGFRKNLHGVKLVAPTTSSIVRYRPRRSRAAVVFLLKIDGKNGANSQKEYDFYKNLKKTLKSELSKLLHHKFLETLLLPIEFFRSQPF